MSGPTIGAANPIVSLQPVAAAPVGRDHGTVDPALSRLADGTTLQGYVINRDSSGAPIIRTTLGDLRVGGEVFLKTGSEVVLRVDSASASRARILTVDGQPLEQYAAAASAQAGDSVTRSGLAGGAAPAAGGEAPPVVQALVVAAPPAPSPQGSTSPGPAATAAGTSQPAAAPVPFPPGSVVSLTVFDLKLPASAIALSAIPQAAVALRQLLPAAPPAPAAPAANAARTPASFGESLTAGFAATLLTEPDAPPPAPVSPPSPANAPIATPASPTTAPALSGAGSANLAAAPTPAGTAAAPDAPALSAADLASASPQFAAAPVNANPLSPPASPALSDAVFRPAAGLGTTAPAAAKPQELSAPPAKSPPPFFAPAPPEAIAAEVIGQEADGSSILHSAVGTLKIFSPQPLPTGTVLQVVVTAQAIATAAAPADDPASKLPPALALQALVTDLSTDASLAQAPPEAVRAAFAQLVPLGPRFTSAAAQWLSALQSAQVEAFLTPALVRALENVKSGAGTRLQRLLQEAAQQWQDAAPGNWLSLPLPLALPTQLMPTKFYVRREPPEEEGGAQGQRFVLALQFSQLGEIQLDGFLRRHPSGPASFDMILRSAQALSAQEQSDLQEIFTRSVESGGWNGRLSFQAGQQHFFTPARADTSTPYGAGGNAVLA